MLWTSWRKYVEEIITSGAYTIYFSLTGHVLGIDCGFIWSSSQTLSWENCLSLGHCLSCDKENTTWQKLGSGLHPLHLYATWCPTTSVLWNLWSFLEEGRWILWIIIKWTAVTWAESLYIFNEPVLTVMWVQVPICQKEWIYFLKESNEIVLAALFRFSNTDPVPDIL